MRGRVELALRQGEENFSKIEGCEGSCLPFLDFLGVFFTEKVTFIEAGVAVGVGSSSSPSGCSGNLGILALFFLLFLGLEPLFCWEWVDGMGEGMLVGPGWEAMEGDSQSVIWGFDRVPVPHLLAFFSFLCATPSDGKDSATSEVDIIVGNGCENFELEMSEKLVPGP